MVIFIQNKHTKIYYQIINRSKNRQISGYVERHHIIPKSLGGSDNNENIAVLTAREHFICHCLLPKMLENTASRAKMLCAIRMMKTGKNKTFTARLYEMYRPKIVEAHKLLVKGKPQRKRTVKERNACSKLQKGLNIKNPLRMVSLMEAARKANTGVKRDPSIGEKISKSQTDKPKIRRMPYDEWILSKRRAQEKCIENTDMVAKGKLISKAKLQAGKRYTEEERKNLVKGKIERFIPVLLDEYGKINDGNIKDAKIKNIIPKRTQISEKTLLKVYGKIPNRE